MRVRQRRAMPKGNELERVELAERLRERRGEIEEALLTRTYAIADPAEAADPEYAEGLRAAVSAALDYGIEAIAHGDERMPLPPAVLLTQARIAARNGIPLDTVLRRYFAGYTLLEDFLMREVDNERLVGGQALKRLVRSLASLFDRLIAAVAEEYAREGGSQLASTDQRRAERVERLLAGELVDAPELRYDFDGWSLGVVASGGGAAGALIELARAVDCNLLLIRRDESSAWAWLGSRKALDPSELMTNATSQESQSHAIAIGEPASGLAGWRLTHRQALAALSIAQRGPAPLVSYREIAVLTTALQDNLLTAFLRETYLDPLDRDRSGTLRATLEAYFSAASNSASTAAALGVTRQTVNNRLRVIEERLARPIASCYTELDLALRLARIDPPRTPG